jgi:hypothetical protein
MKTICLLLLFSTLLIFYSSQNFDQITYAQGEELNIKFDHDNSSELKICLKSKDYKTLCENFDFKEISNNPYFYVIDVDDIKKGKTFQLCYESKSVDECKKLKFSGNKVQRIDFTIEGSNITITEDKTFDYGIPEIHSNSNSPIQANLGNNINDDIPPIPSKGTDDDIPPIPSKGTDDDIPPIPSKGTDDDIPPIPQHSKTIK